MLELQQLKWNKRKMRVPQRFELGLLAWESRVLITRLQSTGWQMGMQLSLYDDDDCFYRVLFSAIKQTLHSHVILHEWIAFYSAFLNIHQSVVLTALAWLSYIYISPSFYLTDLLALKIFSVIMLISERGVTIYLQYSAPSCPKEFSNQVSSK